MGRLALVLLAGVLVAPGVAGTPGRLVAAMEDGRQDVTLTDAGHLAVAVPEVDVTRVAFTLTDDALVVGLDVADLAHRTDANEATGFVVYAGPSGEWRSVAVLASWVPSPEGGWPVFSLYLWPEPACATCAPAPATTMRLDGAWDADASRVTVDVPRAPFTEGLRDVRVLAVANPDAPLVGSVGLPRLALADLVPDHGAGVDVPMA